MVNITVDKLIKGIHRKGYDLFEDDSKPFNLNIIGVRSLDMTPDKFNDTISIMWRWNGSWNIFTAPATTDAGLYYLKNPIAVDGTFILAEGQHKGMWKKGFHKGYPALQQDKPVKGYRDGNRDECYDLHPDNLVSGMFGINGHRAKDEGHSNIVNKWSAGCQVWQWDDDHEIVMELVTRSIPYWGNSFTYTLLNEADVS